MLLWWEISRRPVGCSCFGLTLGWECRRQKTARDESWAAPTNWNSDESICPRHQDTWGFAVRTPHPSHPPACLCLYPQTRTQFSFVTVFLLLVSLLPLIYPLMYGFEPPSVSNCKIQCYFLLSFQANHIRYVSASFCTVVDDVRRSWMQNNTNTNGVRKKWKNRTVWKTGIKSTRSGISGHGWLDRVLATVLLRAGAWIRDFQKPVPANAAIIWRLLMRLEHSGFH